ncbi:MAG: DUF309 domain-containing protein [bacterium]
MSTVEKRIQETDFSHLDKLQMSASDWQDFERGIVLFNNGKFWESHEAWEAVWLRHSERSRIFFQGLIQVAAGLHQLDREVHHGAEKHFKNALWKLKLFQPSFLGVDVEAIVESVEQGLAELNRLGEENLPQFNHRLIPKIVTKK